MVGLKLKIAISLSAVWLIPSCHNYLICSPIWKNFQPSRFLFPRALAQDQIPQFPNPVQPKTPSSPLKNPQLERQPLPSIELNPTNPASSSELKDTPGNISVKRFDFKGNTAFSDAELREAIKKLTNKKISFGELLQAEEIIKDKYTEGCISSNNSKEKTLPCYINSGAFISANQEVTPENAVVKIQVVEGGIENIEIEGLSKLKTNYISSRLQRGIPRPLERESLLEQLQILQLDPLIKNISAELAAGSRPEKSILEINIIEADSFNIDLFTDNARSPSVGSLRRGIGFNEGNLLGFGDRLTGEYINTNGSNGVDLSYSVPINSHNTSINARGGVTSTEVVEEPFDRAEILGDSYNLEFGVRQPVYRTPTTEIAVGLSGSRQESNTEAEGRNIQLSPGADINGETRVSALRFSQEYTRRTLKDVLAGRSQFNVGLDILDSSTNEDPIPDSRFFAWRGQGQYVRRLGQDTLVVFRSDLQFATTNLVPLEEFSVGGIQSVRGYRQDAVLTDNGFFSSAEVRLPIYKAASVEGLLSIVPFLDFGVGWNDDSEENPNDNKLLGMGMGLQWQMGDQLNARLDYAFPLLDAEDSGNTLQEDGIYFLLNYSPF